MPTPIRTHSYAQHHLPQGPPSVPQYAAHQQSLLEGGSGDGQGSYFRDAHLHPHPQGENMMGGVSNATYNNVSQEPLSPTHTPPPQVFARFERGPPPAPYQMPHGVNQMQIQNYPNQNHVVSPPPPGAYDPRVFYDTPITSMDVNLLRAALQFERDAHETTRSRFAVMLAGTQERLDEIRDEFGKGEDENAVLRGQLRRQQQGGGEGHVNNEPGPSWQARGRYETVPTVHPPRRGSASRKPRLPIEARGAGSGVNSNARRRDGVMSPNSRLQTGGRIELLTPRKR